jgi:uncharacterized repeat protein (TIGR01451 family)
MIVTASPVKRTHRSLDLVDTRRRRALSLGVALALAVTALLVVGPAPTLANHVERACTTNQQQGTLCVTVTDSPDPVAYSTFDGNSAWLLYRATVTNASRSSSLSHVQLHEALPEGTTFVSVTSSRGSCIGSGQSVDCSIGSLKKGQSAIVEVVVTAPASAELDPGETTITNAVTGFFDERLNDQAGGKQDQVTYSEPTTVSKAAGQAYVPIGQSGKVGTDPGRSQYASSSIPNASTNVLAALQVTAPDDFCPLDGTVRIQNKTYICRAGGFVEASVTNAANGATYVNAQNPMVFHLRWDGLLVSDKQTVKNFVVFYQSTAAAPIQVFDTLCNETASNTPCLKNINMTPGGGIEGDLVKPDNGRMR